MTSMRLIPLVYFYVIQGFSPDFPRRVFAGPKTLQVHLVPQRVHVLPEASVLVCSQTAISGQHLKRFALPDRGISRDIVERRRFEHKETTIDPSTVPFRFFPEVRNLGL